MEYKNSHRMPVIFAGHGSPMNAIQDNPYTRAMGLLGQRLPRPRAILCVSAHWMTEGTWITAMEKPKTIHDFHGFPQDLFDVQYPAPGSPTIVSEIQSLIRDPKILSDTRDWGLDHGAWAVLLHIYPQADIPVMQLSINIAEPPGYHFKLGQELRKLREKGILIVGSGNVVHNLRRIRWEPNAKPFDWAVEYDEWVKKKLIERDTNALVKDFVATEAGKLSVPTPEHYYPLLYVVGAAAKDDELKFDYEEIQNASISMRCFSFS